MNSPRDFLTELFRKGVAAASPSLTLPGVLPKDAARGETLLLGAGKAAAEMAKVARRCLAGAVRGCVVTRRGHGVDAGIDGVEVIEAGHPLPDENSLLAGQRFREAATRARPGDRVIFLISGGGSALLTDPLPGIALEEKMAMTRHLVRSGAPIQDINRVRRHVSNLKGGRLASVVRDADIISVVLSDVVGDDPATIASGPSIASAFEPEQALAILARHGWKVSAATADAIRCASPPLVRDHPVHVIGTNGDALDAVARAAVEAGWTVIDAGRELIGDAAAAGRAHAALVQHYVTKPGRHLLISGGELTVTVRARDGCGGPNLEYLTGLMAALPADAPVAALAGDSDGIDGTEDNAGGYFEAAWAERAQALGFAPNSMLAVNQTHKLFEALGGLVITGPTRTNVNDIRMIAVEGACQ